MASNQIYDCEAKAIDAGVEWFVKGANIGLFFGIFFAKEDTAPGRFFLARCGFSVAKNMLVTGGVLGSWQFVAKGMHRSRGTDDFLNYSIPACIVFPVWHRAFGITTRQLPYATLAVGVFAGILGQSLLIGQNAN